MAGRLRRVAVHAGGAAARAPTAHGDPLNANGLSLGRILGFPTLVEPSALVLLVLFALMGAREGPSSMIGSVVFAAVLFGSVLVHELGHAVAARLFRLGPIRITLNAFGGLTRFGRIPAPGPGVVVTLAGPLAGFGLAMACYAGTLLLGPGRAERLLETVTSLNLFWSAFNLLPMLPLDGGIVTLHGLTLAMGPRRATRWTAIASLVVGAVVVLAAVRLHQTFIAIFAVMSLLRTAPLAFGTATR